jgi:UDPglucose 6-dehydrogenase
MNVGFIGLGKLGLPVATAMASRGIEVFGYDPKEPDIQGAIEHEEGFREVYISGKERLHVVSLQEVVENCDVIFCAVQTPHEPRFEGIRALPKDRADFDYTFLKRAIQDLVGVSRYLQRNITLAVISTVLPGTMKREVEPLLSERVSLVYNPSFIAMGSTIRDFLDPEFVLLGGDADERARLIQVYCEVFQKGSDIGPYEGPRFYETSIPNAELIKVAYNTFIGLKLAFANTLMEVCHKTDCDVDEVTGALKLAHRRLISGAYLDGGMGDGGGCHPRDNIALSWLARELDLSYDLFSATMEQREAGTDWLARMLSKTAQERKLPPGILGIAYKPGSHIETGSPARLAKYLMHERLGWAYGDVRVYDPHTKDFQGSRELPEEPCVWLVGCRHPEFADLKLPEGSVVIDPWRYIPDQDGVEVIRIGQHSPAHHGEAREGGGLRQVAA